MTSTASRPALRPGPRRLISQRQDRAQPADGGSASGGSSATGGSVSGSSVSGGARGSGVSGGARGSGVSGRAGSSGASGSTGGASGSTGGGSGSTGGGRAPGGKLLGAELLGGKLQIPVPDLEMLPRQRVTGLLQEATHRRVTLVTGPAGSGKTVACAMWAGQRADRQAGRWQIGWLGLDPEDAEPAAFWPYLVAAMIQAGVIPAEAIDQFSSAGADELPEQVMTVVGHATLRAPAAVVIDNVHHLACSGVLAGLDQLIKRLPGNVHLVLAGRSAPGHSLARLRVSGDLADIGPAELACTADELDGYLAMLGIQVEPADRARLLQRTEGWLAGLRLAAMSWPDRSAGPSPSPSAGPDALADYLREEVLAGLDGQARMLLLRTSLFDVVPGELAVVLTADRAAAKTLDMLAREHRLVEHVGTAGCLYRYHPMLRELLIGELRSELPAEESALQQRAALWYAEHDLPVEAVVAAASASDWELATKVLADAGPGVLSSGRPAELERAVTVLPADQQATAVVATAMAAAQLWQDQPALAGPLLDRAVDAMPAGATAGRRPAGRTARRPDRRWLAALRVMQSAGQPGQLPAWLPQAWAEAEQGQLAAATVADHQAVGLLWLALGWAGLRSGNVGQARLALGHASQQLADAIAADRLLPGPAQFGMAELRDRAQAWLAIAAAEAGELTAATGIAAELSATQSAATQDVSCLLALAAALVSLCRDDTAAARLALDDAAQLAFGQLAGEPRVAALAGLIRARCTIADNDLQAARPLLAQLEATYGTADPVMAMQLQVLGRYAALAAGEPVPAAGDRPSGAGVAGAGVAGAGVAGAGVAGAGVAGAGMAEEVLCQARLLLADGAFTEALEMVSPLLAAGQEPARMEAAGQETAGQEAVGALAAVPTRLTRITALLHAAVAHRGLGEAGEAAQHLLQALALAEPEDCYLPFLSGGVAVRSAITVLLPPPALDSFARAILERFDGQLPAAGSNGQKPARPSLTESELAVLRFLPSHMTNQEIAEALFLSINTVKTHLSAAYRKLGAANRRQAIGIGRRSGLL